MLKNSKFITSQLVLKYSSTILLILFLRAPVMAQDSISGKVTDTLNQALPYVDVILKNSVDDDIINGTITDQNGHFSLALKEKGDYLIQVSYIGFQTQNIPLNSEKMDNNLQIKLKENVEQLNAVVLEATKPIIQQKIDRFIFNIDQTVSGSIGTANDALESTPGIKVSDDKLEIVGKGEVRVLVNGKMIRLAGKDLHTYLNSISADNIKHIEVISTPPAKYEAEGNSGLINIVLKEAKQDSWSNTIRTNYKQCTYPSFGIGDAFLYQKNKLQISASLDATKGYKQMINELRLNYDEEFWQEPIYVKNKLDNISGNFNLDYDLSSKAAVGISYNGSFSNSDDSDHTHTVIFDNAHNEKGSLNSNGYTDNPISSNSIGAYYSQKLDTLGRKLSLNIDYFGYQNSQDRLMINSSNYSGQKDSKIRNKNDQDIENYSVSLNMEHPTDWVKISYGGKLLFTKNINQLEEEILMKDNPNGTSQNDRFKYQENVQALYVDITRNFGEKWTAKAGMRFENSETKGLSVLTDQDFKRNYAKWFPSAFLNYQLNEENTFNLSYSRRISRPGFWALNPTRWYINSNSYSVGNPFLQPKFTDNVVLKHIFKNKLSSSLFVSIEDNGYNQIPTVDPDTKQQTYTFDNYYNLIATGLSETFNFKPLSWWKSTSQATFTYLDGNFKSGFENLGTFKRGFNFHFYTDHNFFLNSDETLQLEATYTYESPKNVLMYELGSTSSLDLGIKALFMNKKLKASLSLKDIFQGTEKKIITYTNNIKQVYLNYYDNRSLQLSLTYSFGNENLNVKNRKAENKDIQDRTK